VIKNPNVLDAVRKLRDGVIIVFYPLRRANVAPFELGKTVFPTASQLPPESIQRA
jgi:hypothetical protein